MRINTNPDKYIRAAFFSALKGELGDSFPIYDTRVPNSVVSGEYIILSTQTKDQDDQFNKCEDQWDCTILLDCVSIVKGTGNSADRAPINDVVDSVIKAIRDLSINGFKVNRLKLESSNTIVDVTDTENVLRELLRYRLWLIEVS